MSVEHLTFAEPFFPVIYIIGESQFAVRGKSIILNLSQKPIHIRHQRLDFFRSTVVMNIEVIDLERCLIIGNFDGYPGLDALFERIKKQWTIIYEATHLERHKGVQLYRSPKIRLGNDIEVNMCYADSIPLNVGLHRTHWGERPIREVHTQIVGFGRMQQYFEQEMSTLYREDYLAPGVTHDPMYDDECVYPWHQYEPVTKGVYMATEMQI